MLGHLSENLKLPSGHFGDYLIRTLSDCYKMLSVIYARDLSDHNIPIPFLLQLKVHIFANLKFKIRIELFHDSNVKKVLLRS